MNNYVRILDIRTPILYAPSYHSQLRERHHARTLCSTVGLTLSIGVLPLLWTLSLLVYFYHYYYSCFSHHSLLYEHMYCTSSDHISVILLSCIYTCVPVSVSYSLTKASIGC